MGRQARVSVRSPPVLASWLLAHLATGYRRESLVGDLLEQYQEGQSAGWYWRQVAIALGWALVRLPRVALFAALTRVSGAATAMRPRLARGRTFRLLKQLSAALALVTLGAATLAWAAGVTTHRPADAAQARQCAAQAVHGDCASPAHLPR